MPQHFKGKTGAARTKALREHRAGKRTKITMSKKTKSALSKGYTAR